MAAYAALISLMQIIDDIQNHPSPPISLHNQQLQSLIQNVSFLQKFLEGYTSPLARVDDEADPLEIRIAHAAHAAEDVIESHILELTKLSRPITTSLDRGVIRSRRRSKKPAGSRFFDCFRGKRKPKTLPLINQDDDEHIKTTNLFENLPQVIEEMDLIKKAAMEIDAVVVHDRQWQRNVVSASTDASLTSSSSTGHNHTSMVCSDDVLLGIMDRLVARQPNLQVIPIVGMGGIGKTTLAMNIYAQPLIKEHFDICVWVTISQQYNTREILCELLSRKEDNSGRSDDELGLELYKFLFGRRFLIVMDDMWSIDAWDKIQRFFPNNENGSRVVVTTRLSELSSQLNNMYSLQMQFLDEVSSWNLFSKTVFGEKTCPLELVRIGKEIVESCRGLPLSIVVVGGLLKRVGHDRRIWKSIRNNSTSLVNLENDKHCLRLLKMSYDHLPVYLKPCFLYMGVFEEDSEIRVSKLIKLWIAEGLLKPTNGESLETIARRFLKELIDRNLILMNGLGSTGNIKWCKIHDSLRDLCLRESRKYEFYHVIGEGSPKGISNHRRVVIDTSTNSKGKYYHSAMCQNFRLLRTLDQNTSIMKDVDDLVFECVNLRHLAVKVISMSAFLSSLDVFWNLHTLIVYCWDESNAPVGIWKMSQFRHIEFNIGSLYLPDPPPSNEGDDVVEMQNLEILKGVKNFKCGEDVVKRISKVKKLGIIYCDNDDDYCLNNIQCLCNLESLDIKCVAKLRVVVHKLTFPHSLKSLSLWMTDAEFEWEEMLERIGSLPLLQKLKMWHGCFPTRKWEIVEGQFPSLKYLRLYSCSGLKHWTTQESCMFPRLEQLHLLYLKELEEIPSEIGDILTLQLIELDSCSESAVKSVKEILEEQVELRGEQVPFRVVVRIRKNKVVKVPNSES